MKTQPPDKNLQDKPEVVLKLAEEQVKLSKEQVVDGRVTVTRATTEHDEVINTLLRHEKVEVEHVPKAQRIEVMPEIREEDGVLIVPVVEEEIEIVRKLILREELHIRRVEQQVPFEEVVTLRKQHVKVEKEEEQPSSQSIREE
ncbi:DUF2382 domain-containing protein [Pantoea osteomyelitidis]|uniref:DUF2382 domain-containing protein n=1 Tax=Pantoea osteomyelitidis TaxID=3230026 RepID=A0ABW7Q3L5_9GAMM